MSTDGRFTDRPGLGDWWGRAVWALGIAAAGLPAPSAQTALAAFHRAAADRTPYARAAAFASLGAAEVLRANPADLPARELLRAAVTAVRPGPDPSWPWPEPRLRYDNARLAEALLAAGDGLGDGEVLARGLGMLRFLLGVETRGDHLSVSGTAGRGPGDDGPQFDQQPIEIAAIADACARAFDLTGDLEWRERVGMAWAWFTGDNDIGIPLFDPDTGAGFDGLTPDGRNENRGAESTLAMLSTFQQAHRLDVVRIRV